MILPSRPFSFLWFILKKNRVLFWAGTVIVIAATALGEALHIVLKQLIDSITENGAGGELWFWAVAYPLTYFLGENLWRTSGFVGMRLITKSEAHASEDLFQYLIEHSIAYFNNRFAGSLVNKIGHASRALHNFVSNYLWQFLPLIIQLVLDMVIVLFINVYLWIILFVWTVLFLGLNYIFVRRKQHLSYASAAASSEMKGKMVDSISNIAAIHASAQQEHEKSFVKSFIWEYQKSHAKSWYASEWILFMNGCLLTIFMFAMVGTTVILMQNGIVTIGSLVLIITMTISLQSALFFIGSKMTDAIDDYSQLSEGLNELIIPYDIEDKRDAKNILESKGRISFSNVSFQFENITVFKDFSLDIKPGEKIGIVGVSGAGKSTLINLLLRNYDVDDGLIRLDDEDIRDVTRASLRRQIAFVPQDVSLFHRSILENIRYGKLDATDDQVIEAAKKAQSHEFIKTFSKGYKTIVGERGVKLSGGQRQRIAIARAFLRASPIIVLDEATSSLDSESELLVQRALAELMRGRTVLAIAHRLSTLQIMDRIVVLDNGRIMEDGSHAQLISRDGHYSKLWKHQVSGFIGEE